MRTEVSASERAPSGRTNVHVASIRPSQLIPRAPLEQGEATRQVAPVPLCEPRRERDRVEGVDEEPPARHERARHGAQHTLVVRLLDEVAEGGEEVQNDVELLDAVELPHVASLQLQLDAGRLGVAPRELER